MNYSSIMYILLFKSLSLPVHIAVQKNIIRPNSNRSRDNFSQFFINIKQLIKCLFLCNSLCLQHIQESIEVSKLIVIVHLAAGI